MKIRILHFKETDTAKKKCALYDEINRDWHEKSRKLQERRWKKINQAGPIELNI